MLFKASIDTNKRSEKRKCGSRGNHDDFNRFPKARFERYPLSFGSLVTRRKVMDGFPLKSKVSDRSLGVQDVPTKFWSMVLSGVLGCRTDGFAGGICGGAKLIDT
jgi:hypothetical protein